MNEVEKENCLLNSETCKTCIDFGCNRKVNFSQYDITNESILNDSPQNDDTKRHRNMCSNCNDTCFTQVIEKKNNNVTINDCVLDSNANKNKRSDKSLSEHFSNDQHEMCIDCNSIDDENCRTNTGNVQGKTCNSNGNGCYLKIVNQLNFSCFSILFAQNKNFENLSFHRLIMS